MSKSQLKGAEVKRSDLGFFGNIWVRQNLLEKAGQSNVGHKHAFDHVSLLTSGTVQIEIEGHPPKQFTAPTFIVIRKEHNHKFTAISDDVNWYCVFAIRNLDGKPVDDEELYDQELHDPRSHLTVADDYWEKADKFEKRTTDEDSH